MKTVEHIFEPSRLVLVWHNSDLSMPHTRRIVGEIIRHGDDYEFQYLIETEDYKEAVKEGFIAFPAFAEVSGKKYSAALDVFKRRLPPTSREDYSEYLSQYSLPSAFTGSTFALLGYTGARLASDTFELCPDLSDAEAPLDLLFELSGTQHYLSSAEHLKPGDKVDFVCDGNNPHDSFAVKAVVNNQTVGFINRSISKGFCELLSKGKVTASVVRAHHYRKKPRIILLVSFRK